MKFIYSLFALLLCFGLNAQGILSQGIEGLQLMTKESDELNRIQGDPYWSEEFEQGTVKVKGKGSIEAFLRYNVHSEIVEIKFDRASDETYSLANGPDVTYFLNDKKIIADQIYSDAGKILGLFIEHHNGEKYRLLEKLRVEISEAVKAKSGYDQDKPAKMTIDSDFYIHPKDGEAKEIRIKHRDVKKVFPEKHAQEYLSDNKIREVEDLIAFLEFLEKEV